MAGTDALAPYRALDDADFEAYDDGRLDDGITLIRGGAGGRVALHWALQPHPAPVQGMAAR